MILVRSNKRYGWRVVFALAVGILGIAAITGAQTTATPQFEVASLKVVPEAGLPGVLSLSPRRTGGRLTWNATLKLMVSYAYDIPVWRIIGIDRDHSFYSVEATMDAASTGDEVRQMMRGLLTERFGIKSHKEAKEMQGYALAVAKNGPKLRTASETGEAPPVPEYWKEKIPAGSEERIITMWEGVGVSAITGRGVSLAQLAEEISKDLKTSVQDQTGLTGKYYFGFRFQSIDRPAEDAPVGSLFSVLPDETGLRLQKQKGPVEMLVIDRFEAPSAN